MTPEQAFRAAAQMCRDVAVRDYRPLGLEAHATGAELCARVLDIRAEAAALVTVADLRSEWAGICNAMGNGSYRGTEADALARIEAIKSEIAAREAAQ